MAAIRKSLEHILSFSLLVGDFVAIYCSYLTAYYIYQGTGGASPQSWDEILKLSTIPAFMGVVSMTMASVYRCQPGIMELDRLRRLLFAYFWSSLLTISLTFFIKGQDFSRLMVVYGLVLGFAYILIIRGVVLSVFSRFMTKNDLHRRVLILGAGKVGKALARNLIAGGRGVQVLGFLDDAFPDTFGVSVRVGERDFVVPVLGRLSDLEQMCGKEKPNEVIVAITTVAASLHQQLMDRVRAMGISFSIVPSALDLMLTGAEAYSIGRIPLFRIGEKPEFIFTPVLKRIFDIVLAGFIGVLSAPLWVLAAIAVKLDSPGPVLFIHERVGKDGKKFRLFKFRSMRLETDPYATKSRTENGNLVTRVGKWLRRTSVDELPQLINVVRGEMSLVGPRPEMPFIVETYDDLQRMRLNVKPGVTGVWQISADRANPIHENIDYDLYYMENQSFWLDMAILVKTFTSVVKGIGAY